MGMVTTDEARMVGIGSFAKTGEVMPTFSGSVVKDEPMFHKASVTFAMAEGGPVTQAFLEAFFVDDDTAHVRMDQCVLDTRVHMLMGGWWPCIPGWHHDDVERTRPDGQPNYDEQTYRSRHCIAIAGDDVSRTEFAVGRADFFPVPHGRKVYGQWTHEVDAHLAAQRLHIERLEPHRLAHIDDRTWHRGTPATGFGWRWFGRLSYDTARRPANEIRRQTQVYLRDVEAGW